VWVGERKIASLGVYVKHWVSYHGIAVNVAVNPEHFALIRPCGLPVETVSVNDLRSGPIELSDVRDPLIEALEALWATEIASVDRQELI